MIQNMDGLIAGLTGHKTSLFYYASVASNVAGGYTSSWRRGINTVLQGAIPTSASVCTNATAGELTIPTITTEKLYIARLGISSSVTSGLILVDRLAHMGGLSGTTYLTAQAVNLSIATPASNGRCDANGTDVEWYLEHYTATGSTAVTFTVTYVDQTDTTRTVTMPVDSIPASTGASRMIPIFPNVGQRIKSITSVQLSASTGTAGNFGVTAVKRLLNVVVGVANIDVVLDFGGTGLPEIQDDSCLMFIQQSTNATVGTIIGSVSIIKG